MHFKKNIILILNQANKLYNFCYSFWEKKNMPGHVKKSDGPDPSPDNWLIVSDELKVKLKSKPYDPKKSCWVPDKATGGYFEGMIESLDGEKATVKILETKEVIIYLFQYYIR